MYSLSLSWTPGEDEAKDADYWKDSVDPIRRKKKNMTKKLKREKKDERRERCEYHRLISFFTTQSGIRAQI